MKTGPPSGWRRVCIEDRIKAALKRAGRPLSFTELKHRRGVPARREAWTRAIRSALNNLLDGGEVRAFEGTMPGFRVKRRRVMLYELKPGA
jgi:hypothetical protein